ncbi:unnamed protein product [Amoebophrya sp. A120]|nr:unnamed protein product [Amoebophrya sp. A120]|eukprot:GSA120T00019316001.1
MEEFKSAQKKLQSEILTAEYALLVHVRDLKAQAINVKDSIEAAREGSQSLTDAQKTQCELAEEELKKAISEAEDAINAFDSYREKLVSPPGDPPSESEIAGAIRKTNPAIFESLAKSCKFLRGRLKGLDHHLPKTFVQDETSPLHPSNRWPNESAAMKPLARSGKKRSRDAGISSRQVVSRGDGHRPL